jgi:hypothetical protein
MRTGLRGPLGPARAPAFRAGKVTLVDVRVGTPEQFMVPMCAFVDIEQQLTLSVPALRLSDLSAPGEFHLTERGRG